MRQLGLLEPLDRRDPARVGPYVVLGRLGAGSMGRVYLARSASGRLVAVKTIRAELAREDDFRARFGHEVAAARRVSGVYTASVVAADTDAEVPWLATAYVPAPSLERLVEVAGPLEVPAVRWLAAGCAEALESIHATGLVHRDLKPSNVLISLDGPRVIDFGLAHARERARMTVSRVAVGTPAYMAPEQAQGTRGVTAASDVYALGSVLLYTATGHGPYPGEGMLELMAQLATLPPDLAGLPEELAPLVRACLERDPAMRPGPAEVLASVSPYLDLGAGASYLSGSALGLVRDYQEGPRLPLTETPGRVETEEPFVPPREEAPPTPTATQDPTTSSVTAFLKEPRNRLASVLAVVLVFVGVLMGRSFWPEDGSADRQDSSPRPARPPAQAEPPPPVSGAGARPTGKPKVVVNQPQGDGWTVFVVHGTGWKPGERIRVRLDGSAKRAGPVVDRKGTFNYAVNQSGEFHQGELPLGSHTFAASHAGKRGPSVSVTFLVHP